MLAVKNGISNDSEISEVRIKPPSYLHNVQLSLFLHGCAAKTSSRHDSRQHFLFVSYATSTRQIVLDMNVCVPNILAINFFPHLSFIPLIALIQQEQQ